MSAINEFKDMPLSEFSETESASESTPVEKIPEYVPTQWVDETEPDIDADHLNHIEDGIKKVTDGVNNIIENGGGSFVPSDGYVYIDQEESEENPDPVDVPVLDADTFGGQLPSYYAPQHEISDAFSEGRDYATGDYCIQSNTLYRFTSAKPAGAWDGTKAVPVTVMGEIGALNAKTGFTHLGHSGEGSYYYIDFTPYTQGVYFIYTSIGIYAQFSIVIKTNNAISLLLQSSSSTSVENNNTLKQHTSAWYGNVYIKKLLK